MSDVPIQDLGKIWHRLFDHKPFLQPEIQQFLHEFEEKRCDLEVDTLFRIIETSTDIREHKIGKVQEVCKEKLPQIKHNLLKSLVICEEIEQGERDAPEEAARQLEEYRAERQQELDRFMKNITKRFEEIDETFEQKQEELKAHYKNLQE